MFFSLRAACLSPLSLNSCISYIGTMLCCYLLLLSAIVDLVNIVLLQRRHSRDLLSVTFQTFWVEAMLPRKVIYHNLQLFGQYWKNCPARLPAYITGYTTSESANHGYHWVSLWPGQHNLQVRYFLEFSL